MSRFLKWDTVSQTFLIFVGQLPGDVYFVRRRRLKYVTSCVENNTGFGLRSEACSFHQVLQHAKNNQWLIRQVQQQTRRSLALVCAHVSVHGSSLQGRSQDRKTMSTRGNRKRLCSVLLRRGPALLSRHFNTDTLAPVSKAAFIPTETRCQHIVQFQFKTASEPSGKPMRAPSCLSEVFPFNVDL